MIREVTLARIDSPLLRLTLREHAIKRALIEQCALSNGKNLLDVGSGTGTRALMHARAKPRVQVTGVDGDPTILRIAREVRGLILRSRDDEPVTARSCSSGRGEAASAFARSGAFLRSGRCA